MSPWVRPGRVTKVGRWPHLLVKESISATVIMSLQVNLSSPDITKAYQDVVNARGIEWLILTYEKASNDLRVQSTGNGLEDLEEEFSDGRRAPFVLFLTPRPILTVSRRIQYAFARVVDPNVGVDQRLNTFPC